MKIATWNINGIKARLETTLTWLREATPDVACLQEIKSIDEKFPSEPFEDLGYNVATHGQKGFNGVAILSKAPLEDVRQRLPGDEDDEQSRYIEATISTPTGAVRVACLYLPNGNPIDTPKFPYKLAWMGRLERRVRDLLADEMPLVVAGDYNVIPMPEDARRPDIWDRRRTLPTREPGGVPPPHQSRPDRRYPRHRAHSRDLHLLGLSSRGLAEKQRHPH